MKPSIAAALAAFAMLAGCSSGPSLPSYGVVPDFELTDQTGKPFLSKQQLDGRVWVANFIFTTCMGPCPRMTSQMRQLGRETEAAGGRQLVSFTIDPWRDTPPKLAEFAARYKADPAEWHFLTGPQPVLQRLSKDVFMLQDVDGKLEHSTRFALVDQKGRIRGFYDSSDAEKMKQLAVDLRALTEAGA